MICFLLLLEIIEQIARCRSSFSFLNFIWKNYNCFKCSIRLLSFLIMKTGAHLSYGSPFVCVWMNVVPWFKRFFNNFFFLNIVHHKSTHSVFFCSQLKSALNRCLIQRRSMHIHCNTVWLYSIQCIPGIVYLY